MQSHATSQTPGAGRAWSIDFFTFFSIKNPFRTWRDFFILPHPSVHTNQWIKIPAVLDVDLGLNTFLQWSSSNCMSVNKPSNFSHVTSLQTKWNYTTHLTIHKRSLKLQQKLWVKEQNLLEMCRWEIREEINETLMVYATKFVPNVQSQAPGAQGTCRPAAEPQHLPQKAAALYRWLFKLKHQWRCRDAAADVRACWTTDFWGVTTHVIQLEQAGNNYVQWRIKRWQLNCTNK